jgi:hypothetical protein
MTLPAHCIVWGYGPSGFDILYRHGDRKALEAPSLDEVGRWKLAFDRESQVVTPVCVDGEAVILLAFKSRVSARAAGDKIRQTACAAVPIEYALGHAVHQRLLDLVPPLPGVHPFDAHADGEPLGHATEEGGPMPEWVARSWAQLLVDGTMIQVREPGSSLADALGTVALLPPAVACRTAVGEGLLPGTEPRCVGVFIASECQSVARQEGESRAASLRPVAMPAFELRGMAEAWFRREILPRTRNTEHTVSEVWDRCAAEQGCETRQLDRQRLLSAMLSDATYDWLNASATDSLAPFLDFGLASGIRPDPVRLAGLIDAAPTQGRRDLVRRLPGLASKLTRIDGELATVIVAVAIEDALRRGAAGELEGFCFDSRTWLGAVLSGSSPNVDQAPFAQVAWSLISKFLTLWAAQEPDVLAGALDRPVRDEARARGGWLLRLAGRGESPPTLEHQLRRLVRRRSSELITVSERLLPAALRTSEGWSSLQPSGSDLEEIFRMAVRTAAGVCKKEPVAVAAVAPLLAQRLKTVA